VRTGALSPLISMVRELAIMSLVKHLLFLSEASAIPFRREPYPTAPLSGLPTILLEAAA
jgi:hypothetical protein